MIHYLKRHQIDDIKYDTCIALASNTRIYAYSWYLDSVADNWSALILNNYEAVMPLPWKQKYFIKYIYPSAWTQQLGIFSKNKIEASLIKEFVNSIPRKFKKITIQFNADNDVSFLKTIKRYNYILPLNKSYNEIYEGYRKDRKDRVKQANRKELVVRNCLFSEVIKISKENYSFLKIANLNYKRLKILTEFIQKNDNGFLLGVYNKNEEIVGGAVFLKDEKRISYLFSVASNEGKKLQATSFLIDAMIKKYASSNYVFDFEGSMISGIASFFRSFGAEIEQYYLYQKPFQLL
jgi:hypothetical protein